MHYEIMLALLVGLEGKGHYEKYEISCYFLIFKSPSKQYPFLNGENPFLLYFIVLCDFCSHFDKTESSEDGELRKFSHLLFLPLNFPFSSFHDY